MPSSYESLKFDDQQRRRTGAFLKCETCGKDFYVYPARMRQAERQGCAIRFCSKQCYVKTGTANPFFGKKHTAESIQKMSTHANRPKFDTGSTNPNFVRFGSEFTPRSPTPKLKVRLIALHGTACQRCGFSDCPGVLEVHHVDRNRRNNRIENLQLLCPTCHAVDHFHARDGGYWRLAG